MPYYNVLQAKSAIASASSYLNTGYYKPQNAINGDSSPVNNSTTRWISQGGNLGEWLQVDIGALVRINKFVMYSGNSTDGVNVSNSIRDADFQVWQNDNWLTVGTLRNNPDNVSKTEIQLDKFYKTDKIRVYFPINSYTGNYRIFEIEAYGRILGRVAKGMTSKNLLPPFTSSQWNYTRPVVSVSPNKLILDLDQSRTNEIIIPAKPNTTYTLSGKTDARVYFVQRIAGNADKSGTGYSNYGEFVRTITTGPDVVGLRVSMTTDDAGNKSYENVMLNEGPFPQPYQVYEPNMKAAKGRAKKNIIPPLSNDWYINGTNSEITFLGPYKLELNPTGNYRYVRITAPVEVGKTYKATAKVTGNTSNATLRIYKGTDLSSSNNTARLGETFTVDASYGGLITIVLGNADQLTKTTIEDFQVEEGTTQTAFERFKAKSRAAKKVPKKNLIDPALITLRAGTNGFNISGSRITFDATKQDYAGINYQVANDADFAGRTVTWSCVDRSPEVTPMLAYKPAGSPSLTYIGADLTTNYKTLFIPEGATNIRFYVQNNANARGNFFIDGWQIEFGDKTPYAPFKMGNKPAVLIPKKNFILPFSKWVQDEGSGMTFDIFTDRHVLINFNSNAQYKGLAMGIDMKQFNLLRGKTITLSAKNVNRFGVNNTQVQLRFSGGTGGNVDFVLIQNTGGPMSITKAIPADFTAVSLKAQTNVVGSGARIEVEDLQLEVGPPTEYEPYKLGAKIPKY